jgi:hypothetical protein
MKLKNTLIVVVLLLISISVLQVFSIPPYAGDIFRYYKSGYFSELDREFKIIRESFLEIKSKSEPVYGWLFLKRISEGEGIEISVYNKNAYLIDKPGSKGKMIDKDVASVLKAYAPSPETGVNGSEYYSIMPLLAEKRCLICHKERSQGDLLGAISFRREFDAHIYYSSERILIFLAISILFAALLFYLIKWAPGKKIKEMFDNL